MLPCKGKAGISSLFDGHKLFDASWQSMSIDVRPICPFPEGECLVEIEQSVDMVLDIDRSKRPRGMYCPSKQLVIADILRQSHPTTCSKWGIGLRPFKILQHRRYLLSPGEKVGSRMDTFRDFWASHQGTLPFDRWSWSWCPNGVFERAG